jgi:hypothetical protein
MVTPLVTYLDYKGFSSIFIKAFSFYLVLCMVMARLRPTYTIRHVGRHDANRTHLLSYDIIIPNICRIVVIPHYVCMNMKMIFHSYDPELGRTIQLEKIVIRVVRPYLVVLCKQTVSRHLTGVKPTLQCWQPEQHFVLVNALFTTLHTYVCTPQLKTDTWQLLTAFYNCQMKF